MSLKRPILDVIRRVFTRPPFEQLMLAAFRGVEYGGFWSRFIPGPHLYPVGTRRTVERRDIKFELDPGCLMQWYVFWDFREKQRERLYSLVRKGDVVLDIGTNIGETLLGFAKTVGDGGSVYGFEPDERTFADVSRNIEINDVKNVRVFQLGVGARQDRVKLFRVDPHNRGMNRILGDEEAGQFEDFTTIETDTLDNIISDNKIDRIDVIKIDIEGHEMHALRGAKRILSEFKPRLFIEVGYTRLLSNGTSPTEMIRFLNGYGYRVFHADTDEPIDENYDFSPLGDGGIDVYAIDRGTPWQ